MHSAVSDQVRERNHYIVDGQPFFTGGAVMGMAQSKGWDGTRTTLLTRLAHGDCTWERLLRPVKYAAVTRREIQQRKHEEMRRICDELDARKRAMGIEYAY